MIASGANHCAPEKQRFRVEPKEVVCTRQVILRLRFMTANEEGVLPRDDAG
jgi:hypothetical protein